MKLLLIILTAAAATLSTAISIYASAKFVTSVALDDSGLLQIGTRKNRALERKVVQHQFENLDLATVSGARKLSQHLHVLNKN